MLGNFSHFLSSADIISGVFRVLFSRKIILGVTSECQTVSIKIRPDTLQTVWTQIRPDRVSGLIWVQTVCKGYLQMTLANHSIMTNYRISSSLSQVWG